MRTTADLIDHLPRNAPDVHRRIACDGEQVGGMYHGDRSRKENLEHGFRLPSALDNRPPSSRNSRS